MWRKTRNRILENIKVQKIGYWWVGISRLNNGKTVLIKWGALPGSIVDCKITKSKKDFVQAHITKIKEYDPNYTDGEVFCPHYFCLWWENSCTEKHKIWCGGCKWQVMSYETQLKLKNDIVLDAFKKIMEENPNIQYDEIIWSPIQKNYRNKIEFSFGKYISDKEDVKVHWNTGFHKQGEFSKIVDIDSCGLISDKANKIFETIKNICKESRLPVHDQKTHEWFFRHLVIREWFNTEQVLVNLAVADQYLIEWTKNRWESLIEEFKNNEFLKENVTCFFVTYNNGLADIVRWPEIKTEIIRWEWHIYEKLIFDNDVNVTFRVSPFSFFQTNTKGAETLFQTAADMVWNTSWTIFDLYCGTWSIGLSFLKMDKWDNLVGIEIVEDAIIDAKHNADINGVSENSFFVASPAEKAFEDYPEIKDKLNNLWLIIVDPPREGLHKNVISFIAGLKKQQDCKILYISCNPITMARDVELFQEKWIELKELRPVDMFPQTHHIECIWILN